jgi:hypothetical protein
VVALAHLLSEVQAPRAAVAGEAENAADVIMEDNLGKEARITIVKTGEFYACTSGNERTRGESGGISRRPACDGPSHPSAAGSCTSHSR